jgi:hypothetical protein
MCNISGPMFMDLTKYIALKSIDFENRTVKIGYNTQKFANLDIDQSFFTYRFIDLQILKIPKSPFFINGF